MRIRSGFSLIEIVVGLLVGSILSLVLYQMFWQTVRTANNATALIDDYSDSLIMTTQLERDLTSIVVLQLHKKTHKQDKKASPKELKAAAVTLETEDKKVKKKRPEEELAFSGIMKDGKLESLSFVTTNALPQIGHPQSGLVYVHYFLAPQRDNPSLAQLMREEQPIDTASQETKLQNKPRAYPVASYIESLTMTFYGRTYDTAKQKMSDLISVETWGNKEQKKKLPRTIPEFIRISGTYQSRQTDLSATPKTIPFSYLFPIPAGIATGIDIRDEEERKAKKAASDKGGKK